MQLQFLTKKQNAVKYFSKLSYIYIPILINKNTGRSTEDLVVQVKVNSSRCRFIYQP